MRRWILAGLLAAAAIALEAWLGGAGGQGAEAAGNAYERLSAGNRRIARALVEAQVGQGRRLTLEEIASRRLRGETWSQVFRSLRARGLVRDRHLAEVISDYNARHRGGSPALIPTVSDERAPARTAAAPRAPAGRRR